MQGKVALPTAPLSLVLDDASCVQLMNYHSPFLSSWVWCRKFIVCGESCGVDASDDGAHGSVLVFWVGRSGVFCLFCAETSTKHPPGSQRLHQAPPARRHHLPVSPALTPQALALLH